MSDSGFQIRSPRRNVGRRAVGTLLCLSLPALFVVSASLGFLRNENAWFRGAWPLAIAAPIAMLNAYLSFIHPQIQMRRLKPGEEHRHVSGIPLIGWLPLMGALITGWAAPGTAIAGLLICFIDTGGFVWPLIATWSDTSFWDGYETSE